MVRSLVLYVRWKMKVKLLTDFDPCFHRMALLTKTSKSLGKIPISLSYANDSMMWVPVDMAARVMQG